MKRSQLADLRRSGRRWVDACVSHLPTAVRSRFARRYRQAVAAPSREGLELKIAESQDELEACFGLLHDAYVDSALMTPHPSGLRVTPYHALPTTTTLCAKIHGRVVGTLTIVRDGVFGFPMQSAFDISSVRAKGGRIAEISALAIHPRYRRTSGTILFPLMKFMRQYCAQYFDTRHLVIAVHPSHIEMYESLLCFSRLTAQTVENYDFVNGAPAVGATLDLIEAPRLFERAHAERGGKRNLHHYFFQTTLPEIRIPERSWHVSNDPVLTPALIDYFFNRRTSAFAELPERRRALLHSVYPEAAWASCLPPLQSGGASAADLRRFPRFSLNCHAKLAWYGRLSTSVATIVEVSRDGFAARSAKTLSVGSRCDVVVMLGPDRRSRVRAEVVRAQDESSGLVYGFKLLKHDATWRQCTDWLESRDAVGIEPPEPVMAGAANASVVEVS